MSIQIEIDVAQVAAVTIVTVSGSIDSITAESLTQVLNDHVEAGNTKLVVDFSEVNYTSSAGLRSLLIALKSSRKKNGDMRLAGVQKNVMDVLELSGFNSIIKIFTDPAAAVASYGS
jgi:anti-sigma B factor antagonist